MSDNFPACLAITLVHEGGWSNHPRDPGGATMKGVIQRTYDTWRDKWGQPRRSVRMIEELELRTIYKAGYWDAVGGDALPRGYDLVVFDASVNSGPGRARQWHAGVSKTARDTVGKVNAFCDTRLGFLKRLGTWDCFGTGWSRRVADVRAKGCRMALSAANFPADVQKKTLEDLAKTSQGKAKVEAGKAGGAGTAATTSAAAPQALGWDWSAIIGFGCVTIIVAGATAYLVVRAMNRAHEAQAFKQEAALV